MKAEFKLVSPPEGFRVEAAIDCPECGARVRGHATLAAKPGSPSALTLMCSSCSTVFASPRVTLDPRIVKCKR